MIAIPLLGLTAAELPPAFATQPVCSVATPADCLNGVSSGPPGGAAMRTIVSNVASATGAAGESEKSAGDASAFRYRRSSSGLPAGGVLGSIGVWGSFGYTAFEGDPLFGAAVTEFDSDLFNLLGGADLTLGQHIVLGLAIGYEDLQTDTAFNGGGVDTSGYTVAPYVLVIFNDYLSLDATGGFSSLENDQDRIDPASAGTLSASFDSDRLFFATNLNLTTAVGRWIFGGQIGYLATEEDQDGYTEIGGPSVRTVADRSLDLRQGHLSADVSYSFGGFEPYARAGYYNDFSRNDGQGVGGLPGGNVRTDFDDDEWRLAFGVRYFSAAGVSGSLEVETEAGRQDFESTSVLLTIRADF